MSLESHLKNLRSIIDKKLDEYLPRAMAYPEVIHRAMRYSVFSGGKRLRPILAIESCRACGGNIAKVVPAACAIELIHTYSLVHDDLPAMDDDDTRRGKPALHKKYNEAIAILAGDALLTLAFFAAAGSSSKILEELAGASGTKGMIAGQVVDLEFAGKKKDKKLIHYINTHKTARLFEASCRIGGLAAGARKDKVDALGRFGRALGVSFQIVDDILDGGDYPKTFGRQRAKADALDFARKAKNALQPIGKSSGALLGLVDYSLRRTK